MRGGLQPITQTGPDRRKITQSHMQLQFISFCLPPYFLSLLFSLQFCHFFITAKVRLGVWKKACHFKCTCLFSLLRHIVSVFFSPSPLSYSLFLHRLAGYWKSIRSSKPVLKSNFFLCLQTNANRPFTDCDCTFEENWFRSSGWAVPNQFLYFKKIWWFEKQAKLYSGSTQ